MKQSIIEFFDDYNNVLKHEMDFYKKHFVGTLVLSGVIMGVSVAPMVVHNIKCKIEERKERKCMESEDHK